KFPSGDGWCSHSFRSIQTRDWICKAEFWLFGRLKETSFSRPCVGLSNPSPPRSGRGIKGEVSRLAVRIGLHLPPDNSPGAAPSKFVCGRCPSDLVPHIFTSLRYSSVFSSRDGPTKGGCDGDAIREFSSPTAGNL